ncbi:MAG TPA: DUF427 domain-containing protein [Planctomycetota bacterium]
MPRAIWNDKVIAESPKTVMVEGNHYFPLASVDPACLRASDHTTVCGWKGTARYHHLDVGGQRNENAAWYYPDPLPAAAEIAGHVAFWKGVRIED